MAEKIIETFDTTTGFSSSSAQLAISQDTVNLVEGSGSLKMTTSTGAGAMLSKSNYNGTAVSYAGSDYPYKAYDGDYSGTRWSSGHDQTVGDWYKIDLGSVYKVYKSRLYVPSGNYDYPSGYKIEVSKDGVNWTQVVYVSAGNVSQDDIRTWTPIFARYVKFTLIANNAGHWWSIYELEIWHYATALNQTVEKTISNTNLASVNTIKVWVRSERSGTNFQFGIGENLFTDNLFDITISTANTWEEKEIDISSILPTNKDGITKIGFKVINVDNDFSFWVDKLYYMIASGMFHVF